MKTHPYLRAYLAGIAVPTVFLLVFMTGYTVIRYLFHPSAPIERFIVFPMAVVPNMWGLWNMLYRVSGARKYVSLGLFGGALPLLLVPFGLLVGMLLSSDPRLVLLNVLPLAFALPIVPIIYYLVWKYFVAFLNTELGIA